MNASKFAFACVGALAVAASAVMGCAGDRPLRNGVPNEQLFLKKSFIIRPGEGGDPEKDAGWMLKATVVSTSTPNPFAESVLFTGAENNGALVRFVATQDQLQLVDVREISDTQEIKDQGTRTAHVITSYAASHGDLKLAVTPDGEKTNRFEENLELDWRQRQWVKVNLAKTDLSDFALFGAQTAFRMKECAAGTGLPAVTLEPNSVIVDEEHDYVEWKVSVTTPVDFTKESCVESYGESGANFMRLGRQNVTSILKYSMVRAKPIADVSYKPLELAEKDPIRRKYGPITETSWTRDRESGQLAARELAVRFDPTKEMVWYFAKGYPEAKKGFWTQPNGIVDQTNKLFEKAGAKVRLVVKNYDQDIPEDAHPVEKERGREYGDVRYNFIRWMSDLDVGAPFIGVAQFVPDPRTGEALSASINIADFPLKEFVAQRVDAFLETIMCHASQDQDVEGVVTRVCAGLNSDAPWMAPMTEVDEEKDGKIVKVVKPLPEQCTPGETAPLITKTLRETYGKSSLYSKMQEYMGEPAAKYGPLGPRDFTAPQDADFHHAYYRLLPYYIFADPATNQFVSPLADGGEFGPQEQMKALEREADFHRLAGALDRGEQPYDHSVGPTFVQQAVGFLDQMQAAQLSHRDYLYKREFLHKNTTKMDSASDIVSFTGVMEKAGRRCTEAGRWETREEWLEKLVQTYHSLTVWHEFGHTLGLDHNFMASVDAPNYPHYTQKEGCDPNTDSQKCDRVGMFSSSVMEYSSTPDRIFWANESGGAGWGPYDRGAIAWLYGNEGTPTPEQRKAATDKAAEKPADGVSGQLSPTMPWNDPEGFNADGTERQFLYCNATHIRYTPFCRQQDFGSTPSEIIANEIEAYEWQYAWRNFRKYRKVWDNSHYADLPAREILEMRRFMPLWRSDWTSVTLRDEFGRLGILPPPGAPTRELYYGQLATKFDDELSNANQMVAAFHLAIIQQSSGERPFATIIDKFTGDVTQQGITLDKQFAMQSWVALWPSDNYDPNQRGNYISSFSNIGDSEYQSIAEKAVASMIGEEVFDSFPYLKSAAVVQFAKDTHNLNFGGNIDVRDWVGGRVFTRERDMLDYFRGTALKRGCIAGETPCKLAQLGCARGPGQATDTPTLDTCTYDPTCRNSRSSCRVSPTDQHLADDYHEFMAPDGHRYAYVYVADRHTWVFADRDRNTATYKILRDYNVNVIKAEEEGLAAYEYLKPVKYFLDAYQSFN